MSAEAMGVPAPGAICSAGPTGDGICSYDPNNGSALAGTPANLVSPNPAGNWQLCIGDAFVSDPVSSAAETINLTIIP